MRNRGLAVAALLSLILFLLLAVVVTYSSSAQQSDFWTTIWVNGLNLGGTLGSILVAASLYGREYFWIPVVGVMFLLGDKRTRLLALGLSALFVVGIIAGDLTKALVMRERPASYLAQTANQASFNFILRVPPETDFSFPSGHALIVSIGAFFSLATFRKKWVAGLLTLEAAVVCFSRVYVGAHYPTDVMGGLALGGAIVLGGLALKGRYLQPWVEKLSEYLESRLGNGPLRL